MSRSSRFVALLPVRDEGDIIAECLIHALTWANRIYVYDTGSVDDTWDIVNTIANDDDRVHPIAREPVYYNENRVRGLLFHTAREYLRDGDWFLRIDADEFHHIRPQDFVEMHLDPGEGVAYHQYYNFQLTRAEAESLSNRATIKNERKKSISERRRHFTASVYAEPRMCRYRSSMCWPMNVSFPYNAGLVAKARLPIRHYPHRDPAQLNRRCRLRALMMADKKNRTHWSNPDKMHWSVGDWSEFIVENGAPGLQYWIPGTDLPELRQLNHIAAPNKRALQRAVYALGLQYVLDLTRRGWTSNDHPLPIATATQEILARELSS